MLNPFSPPMLPQIRSDQTRDVPAVRGRSGSCVLPSSETSINDLCGGPFVRIEAYNNPRTLRLTEAHRYQFAPNAQPGGTIIELKIGAKCIVIARFRGSPPAKP